MMSAADHRRGRLPIWIAWGAVYLFLLLTWKHGFLVWSQINDFHHGTPLQFAPIEAFVPGPPSGVGIPTHLPRVLLTLPILLLGKLFGVSPHAVFTVAAVGLIAWSAWLLGRASQVRDEVFWVALGALSLAMNGRMVFALAGASMLLWAAAGRRDPRQLFLMLFFAAFFCTVSTGAFSVAVAAVGWLLVTRWRTHPEQRQPLIGVLVFAAPWFLSAIEKNVSYFAHTDEGLVVGFLNHGLGKIFTSAKAPWILGAAAVAAVAGALLYPQARRAAAALALPPFTLPLLLLGAAGGLFGYATAIMAAPPALVVLAAAATWAWRRRARPPG